MDKKVEGLPGVDPTTGALTSDAQAAIAAYRQHDRDAWRKIAEGAENGQEPHQKRKGYKPPVLESLGDLRSTNIGGQDI
jgi:hypothetical protein